MSKQLTPKEQAKELINQFMNADMNIPHAYAVHCAVMEASDIALELKKYEAYWRNDIINPVKYWQEVVTEINLYQ